MKTEICLVEQWEALKLEICLVEQWEALNLEIPTPTGRKTWRCLKFIN